MTTPLLISESVPREIENILKSLEIGQPARYKGFDGYIAFVCDEYISICYKEEPQDKSARRPVMQSCLLVYECNWEDIEIEDTHFYDVKNYHGNVNDHPGNEMLPPVTVR
jgi:hypothetical protein